ncbi:DNA-methyltransferase [Streptomyces sp. NPDC015220]|uniref:DNA-methyltransferase n=1 Tax=Streptomyces sp. NPDC015220 TaxID=3364947 RepID=UPI0036F79C9F
MDKPKIYYADEQVTLWLGDALETLQQMPDGSVNCVVTSPPYYSLRDYGTAVWVDADPDCEHQMGDKLDYVCVRCGGVKKDRQYGLESSPAKYVETMRALFAEARRVLADDGTLWLNLGDSYASTTKGSGGQGKSTLVGTQHEGSYFAPRRLEPGLPEKNLLGIPWRTAFALQDDGWILRNEIIWAKPNAMPESVRDRLSNRHEHLFMFSKSPRYHFDLDAIREPLARPEALTEGIVFGGAKGPGGKLGGSGRRSGGNVSVYGSGESTKGRNPGDVWSITTRPYPAAHFAVFPIDLPLRCIKAGCKPGGTVLDPFSGSGTTGAAARQLGRKYIGVDLNPAYHDLAKERFAQGVIDFGGAA